MRTPTSTSATTAPSMPADFGLPLKERSVSIRVGVLPGFIMACMAFSATTASFKKAAVAMKALPVAAVCVVFANSMPPLPVVFGTVKLALVTFLTSLLASARQFFFLLIAIHAALVVGSVYNVDGSINGGACVVSVRRPVNSNIPAAHDIHDCIVGGDNGVCDGGLLIGMVCCVLDSDRGGMDPALVPGMDLASVPPVIEAFVFCFFCPVMFYGSKKLW
jgi:hypothetical protein